MSILSKKDYLIKFEKMDVAKILSLIPKKLTHELAKETGVNHSVQQLRGQVMFDLLLLGMVRSDRPSTRVLETFYNSRLFEGFSSKDEGHQTRHSSLADRLKVISPNYFKAIFEWSTEYFFDQYGGSKLEQKINRFDSTMIAISSALVEWGMRVGAVPKDRPRKVQLKVTLGLKGNLPNLARIHTDQKFLSEENALADILAQNSFSDDDIAVFDRGLKSRKTLKDIDNQCISFVTRGADNLRYKSIRILDTEQDSDDECQVISDQIVHLYAKGNEEIDHEFRVVQIKVKESGKTMYFITNILDLSPLLIAQIYRLRWDIEVFFRFLKQELKIEHLLSRSLNGIKVQMYMALILAILLTVYTVSNNLKGYKIVRLQFQEELLFHLFKELKEGEKLIDSATQKVF